MNILILGGTRESRSIADELHRRGIKLVYSLAGRSEHPAVDWPLRSGGFGGTPGLIRYLVENAFDLVLDLTHPYAARISRNAFEATRAGRIPLWQMRRPAWQPTGADHWTRFSALDPLVAALVRFQRPFFTSGTSALRFCANIPHHQQWLVRVLPGPPNPDHPRLTLIESRGPFRLEDELRLMQQHAVDVLICKNSGGNAAHAKIIAARTLQCPVYMLERPALPLADRIFNDVQTLLNAVRDHH